MGKAKKGSSSDEEWPRTYVDYEGREVILTKERWEHIVSGHPEMEAWVDWVKLALSNPNIVQQSASNDTCIAYYRLLPKIGLYVMVITDQSTEPATIRTSFPTRMPKKGKTIHVRRSDSIV